MSFVFREMMAMEEAFNSVGVSMMSDDFAAKLLAYVSVLGGRDESVVTNCKLVAGIAIAQQKFKIKGGEIPDAKGLVLIQQYTKELETYLKEAKKPFKDDFWLKEVFDRYDLHWGEVKNIT
jgi:hypothetical protein